jgi:hypothetical protein
MKRICGLAALVAACALAVAVWTSATGGANGPGLSAYVGLSNPGPLRACSTALTDCPLNTVTQLFIYTTNSNRPGNWLPREVTRSQIPNAYVVSSVDMAVSVNGTVLGCCGTFTPPPTTPTPAFAGRWPVSCAPFSSPCEVTSPAVLPGETTAPFVSRWIHTADEPDGTYIFTFTLHGTLNGEPVDVTATSKKIVMTR